VDRVFPIPRLLNDLGLRSPEAQAQGRALLEQHGLTRAGKKNLSLAKVERACAVLAGELRRVCGNAECDQPAAARRPEEALYQAGISRLLLLSGTPPQHMTLRNLRCW